MSTTYSKVLLKTNSFLTEFIGVSLVKKLYKVKVCNSIYYIYIYIKTRTLKSCLFPSLFTPLYPPLPPLPSCPSGNDRTVVCLSVRVVFS